jgi:hypothetical protein
VAVAVLTNLILIPASILLIGLFEESRSRISNVTRLKRAIKNLKGSLFNNKIKMFHQRNAFIYEGYCINWSKPWWCKIIAYLVAIVFSFVSIFFIIVKAITLGNHKTTKWLITVILGIIFENILITPIQAINYIYLYIILNKLIVIIYLDNDWFISFKNIFMQI